MINHLINHIKLDLHDEFNLGREIMYSSSWNEGGCGIVYRKTVDSISILNYHIYVETKYYKDETINDTISIYLYIDHSPKFHEDIPINETFILCEDINLNS